MTEYAAPFDRVRTHCLGNHPVLIFLEDVKGSLVKKVVDLNIGRVGNEEKSLRVVIYLPMPGTKSKGLNLLTRIEIL